jgi:4-nitrophenyl phosphatase
MADGKDPEDRVFIESMDWSTIKPDPSVGAVLCGFDAYVSESIISLILGSITS